jgi:hypothetical protein
VVSAFQVVEVVALVVRLFLQLHDFAILVLVQKLTIKMDGNGVHLD